MSTAIRSNYTQLLGKKPKPKKGSKSGKKKKGASC